MTPEHAKFQIIALYDTEYPTDLREAGHAEKAETLELFVAKLAKNEPFTPEEDQQAIDLATFMVAVSGQSQS